MFVTASDEESDTFNTSTVWTHYPIADYLSSSSHDPDNLSSAASETEGEVGIDNVDEPSLGYLDDVLGFIAAERARWTAQRETGVRGSSSQASTSESARRHVVEPRRKRRRKRGKHGTGSGVTVSRQELEPPGELENDAEIDVELDG